MNLDVKSSVDKTGLELFTRLPGKLIPTEEAYALFQDVERLFIGLEDLELSVENIWKFGNGRLRIVSVPLVSFSLLPKAIARFNENTPGIPISIHTYSSSMVAHWVASRFCDFGIVSCIRGSVSGEQPMGVSVFLWARRFNNFTLWPV